MTVLVRRTRGRCSECPSSAGRPPIGAAATVPRVPDPQLLASDGGVDLCVIDHGDPLDEGSLLFTDGTTAAFSDRPTVAYRVAGG